LFRITCCEFGIVASRRICSIEEVMNYYTGRLGKDGEFALVSEAPIILWKQGMAEFIGLRACLRSDEC
jgi:hypothetical protein